MLDYEKIFTSNLHSKLKKKINGSVYCEVNQRNELYIYRYKVGERLCILYGRMGIRRLEWGMS